MSVPRQRLVAAAVGAVCCLAGSAVAATTPGGGTTQDLRVPLDDPRVYEPAREAARERDEAASRIRASGAERELRVRSRTQHATLTDKEAIALLRERKTPVETFGAYKADQIEGVKAVRQFVGERAAQVTSESGETHMLVSDVPLRTENRDEKLSAVDLTLTPDGDVLRIENPLVSARLPRDLADPVVLPDDGLEVAVDAARDAAPAELIGGTAVYPNSAADTDAIIKPLPTGVEISWLARSARSPESFRFTIEASREGEKIELVRGEKDAAIAVQRDGTTTSLVLPPVAADTDGVAVPVSMEIDGNDVIVTALHRDEDVKYPVYIDPPLVDVRNWQAGDPNFASFAYGTNRANYFSPIMTTTGIPGNSWGGGLYIGAYQGLGYNQWDYGQWVIGAPRESFIARMDFTTARHQPDGTAWVGGLFDLRGNRWEPGISSGYGGPGTAAPYSGTGPMYGGTVTSCAVSSCNDDSGHEGNVAVMALSIQSTHTLAQPALALAGGASLRMNDRNNPTSATTGGYLPSSWVSGGTLQTSATVTDPGMGPASLGMYYEYDGNIANAVDAFTSSCFGHACSTALSGTVAVDAGDLPEGPGRIDIVGFDWVLRQSNVIPFPIKVDYSDPEISPYGPLVDQADGFLDESSYTFRPDATDGSAADPRSGVQRLKVSIGGPAGESPSTILDDQTACGDNCAKNPEVTVNANTYSVGEHRISVEATDGVGHVATENFQVKIPPGRMLAPSTGQRLSKLVPLQAETSRSGLTGVTFEFRRASDQSWQTIPASKVKRPNGTTLSGWPAALTSGTTESLSWDARTTTGIDDVDGQIQVRAVFAGSANTGEGRPALIQLDRSFLGSTYATEQVGPGTVTLASGNYAISADDVSIEAPGSDLSVSRTYNSRQGTATPTGVLGPGWTLSTPVATADVTYTQLDVAPDQSVIVRMQDGTEVPFALNGTSYSAPPGFRQLKLVKSGNSYVLTDDSGNETTFSSPSGNPPLVPTSISLAADRTETKWTYESSGGILRPTHAIAPAPAGITCTTGSLPKGCRALQFIYSTSTTATGTTEPNWGTYNGRLSRIDFTASSEAGSPTTDTVAEYRYDSDGKLRAAWDPRIATPLKEKYAYNAAALIEYTPPGEVAWQFEYATLPDDANPGRIRKVKRATSPERTWTMAYRVPLAGSGAPYSMAESNVAQWGQVDLPTDATAVFPPSQVPADPPASFSDATVHYLNANALEVNTALPGGKISTAEYDRHRNVIRELTAQNRVTALAAGGGSVAKSREIDTQRTYNSTGLQLLTELGPLHAIDREGGSATAVARRKTVNEYDTGAPAGGPYNLVLKSTTGAQLTNGTFVDTRLTEYRYGQQDNLGWKLRKPTTVVLDPAGLNLATRYRYDPDTATAIEVRQPSDPNGTTAATTRTTLYTAGSTGPHAACLGKPAQAGMPCVTEPVGSPGGSVPQVLAKAHQYNRLLQPIVVYEDNGAAARSLTIGYDAAGRKTSEQFAGSSGTGTAVPTATFGYHSLTGRPTTTSTSTASITRGYDTLGRMDSYTDAAGHVTSYTYDQKDRISTVSDGKGLRTQLYDLNDNVTTVTDSQLSGSFIGTYDADNQITSQTLPNGITQTFYYRETGEPYWLAWAKPNPCGSDCWLLMTGATRSIHGQTRVNSGWSTLHTHYDLAGRIATVFDVSQTSQCTIRQYLYDANSNRTGLKTWAPLMGGACDFSGSPGVLASSTYDTGDRLTNSGVTYDNLTRTTVLPAAQAGGQSLTSSYYVNDLVASMTQGGTTYTYELDPARRFLARGTTGSITNHYGDDSDSPTWTASNPSGSQYTRPIAGLNGQVAAIYDSAASSATMQYANLHGDLMATGTASPTLAPTSPLTKQDFDEFGVPKTATNRYGWLGTHERSTEYQSGTSLMGVRVYQPQIGRFLQTDPILGGSANAYDYTNQDPLNSTDLSGKMPDSKRRRPGCIWYRDIGYLCADTRVDKPNAWSRCAGNVANDYINGLIGGLIQIFHRGDAKKLGEKTLAKRLIGKLAGGIAYGAAVGCVRGALKK